MARTQAIFPLHARLSLQLALERHQVASARREPHSPASAGAFVGRIEIVFAEWVRLRTVRASLRARHLEARRAAPIAAPPTPDSGDAQPRIERLLGMRFSSPQVRRRLRLRRFLTHTKDPPAARCMPTPALG